MKKISNAAMWTRKKGRECRIEIREPFGNAIVRYLGTEAIRQNPPLRNKGALNRVIPQAEIQPELRASNLQLQSTGALGRRSSATEYRSHRMRCTEGQWGCEKPRFPFVGPAPKSSPGIGWQNVLSSRWLCETERKIRLKNKWRNGLYS